jgi:hypothetical protein
LPVPRALCRAVFERARYRCEYCQIEGWPLTVDHIIPLTAWRSTPTEATSPQIEPDDIANLAAACSLCNRGKSNATRGYDPVSSADVPLFNPRRDHWDDHFAWREDYREIIGLTPVGRATVVQLQSNRAIYQRQRARLRAAMQAGDPPWP